MDEVGDLRASILTAELEREHLRRFARIQRRGFAEETIAGGLCMAGLALAGATQVYYGAGPRGLGVALFLAGTVTLIFWISRRRAISASRDLELIRAERNLEIAIARATEAIQEVKTNG